MHRRARELLLIKMSNLFAELSQKEQIKNYELNRDSFNELLNTSEFQKLLSQIKKDFMDGAS